MNLAAFRGRWVFDLRGQGRGVRVSAHTEAGFLVLSTWKSDECASTVRLLPDEAAQLSANIAHALAELAVPPDTDGEADLSRRVTALEARLAALGLDA